MKVEREDSYAHVLKYTGIFGGVQGLNILINLVRTKLVAMFLGPSGIGLASLFGSVVTFVSQATNLGISFSAVRHVSELFDQGDEAQIQHFVKVVRAWSLLTGLVGMLVCVAAGPLLSRYTFSWGDHTLHFVLLSFAVGLLAVTGGESAILKGARRLKALALIQFVNVLMALLIAVPIYYFFGESGIVPVIVLTAFSAMLTTLYMSYRLYPLHLRGCKGILGEGMGMVRLGVAYVLAGILGSGAEMLIRAHLNVAGELDVVGFYNAGFILTVTYAGMVFSAMESDYFPRLSAVTHDGAEQISNVVNKQIEVSFLLVSPMLAVFILLLPVLLPLLTRADFMPAVPMAQVASFSMYLRALSLPMSFMVLAKGDSLAYLFIEGFDSVLMFFLVVLGFRYYGLVGTGLALDASYLIDLIIIYIYTNRRYGYRFSLPLVQMVLVQLPLGLCVYLLSFLDHSWLGVALGYMLAFVSIIFSLIILHQKTSLWQSLKQRLRSKFRHHE
ncbi:oligosaccharide flippase family protein [Prevotella sp. E13-17]|uniref:oligosaccharide flippase family protein n=1 Tax=Prevotella sp. E13-17 TaxID=2913616 RepID=UPI001EDBA7D8|nr:oligosaccharide flippase family protein [Prevotella sp. E13-17]UKK52000.1 oligosaccharide flippase family protein [Prevotella sp. E13-17]